MQSYYGNNSPDALERIFQGKINWCNLCIVAANVLVFVISEILGDTEDVMYMLRIGASYTPNVLDGEWYRLITCMFLHFGIEHLFNNMLLLLFLGDMLEEFVGKWKYLLIYLGGGLAGNLLSLIVEIYKGDMAVSAGASGAVFAVIGGLFVVLLKNKEQAQDISASRVLFVIVLSIYHGFQSTGVDNVAHIGGALAGILLAQFFYWPRLKTKDRRINHTM